MTADQQETSKMIDLVITVYTENKTDFEEVPALAAAMEQLIVTEKMIDDTVQQQIKGTAGTTKSKADMKTALAFLTCTVAGNISSYASDTQNVLLLEQTKMTLRTISKLNDKLVVPTCRNILNLGLANLDVLAAYGVTAESLQELKQAIDAFDILSTKPQKQIFDRSGDTKKIAALFATATGLLKDKADKLILNLKLSKPETFQKYQAARILPHSSAGKNGTQRVPAIV